MGFIETLCTNCGKCLDICPNDAIRHKEGEHRIDYFHCISCGNCRDHCYYGALVRYGESMTVAEVWDEVRRDRMFYDHSGGGVTVSGGEPLLWAKFVRELFELSHQERIDTCVETCGFADPEALLEVIPVTDHFLFDLKHMNSDIHRGYTGQSNEQILRNAALVLEHGADVVFRQPLIPGVNDSILNIEATAGFLTGLGKNATRLQIMPYHRMGQSKYQALNVPYITEGIGVADDEHIEAAKKAYIGLGIRCTISR
jgi:pyruvate formate lyase activating enzyme